jgi:predicted ATPase with chaperone activity
MAYMLAEVGTDEDVARELVPPERLSFEGLGVPEDLISDLLLKTVHQRGPQTGFQLAECLHISLTTIQEILAEIRHLHIFEVLGAQTSTFGEGAYIYQLTEKGNQRALKAMGKNQYVGPAPVRFADYCDSVTRQSIRGLRVDPATIAKGLGDLILPESLLTEVGPALNSATSIFFFGPPGNGKTSIATRINRVMGGPIFVPHAIEMEGSIMEFYDPMVHVPVDTNGMRYDRRWVRVQRPSVIVGGELTADGLDLRYNEHRRTFQPPYQMKANCGMFLIDDFGRQAINPHQLLNRLIVPLESGVDYITLNTGVKLEVPFNEMVIFSTNLEPEHLADEAFLRRIKYKIHLEDPSPENFRAIFIQACAYFEIEYDDAAYEYLIKAHYEPKKRAFRAVHPRDLLDQVVSLCRYLGVPPVLSRDNIDRVIRTYFADS